MSKKDKKKALPEFYDIGNLLSKEPNSKYYISYGKKSNGKTFAILSLILFGYHDKKRKIDINGYLDDGSEGMIFRRYDEDLKGGKAQSWFDGFIHNPYFGNIIETKTKGKWNSVKYFQKRFYLTYLDPEDEKNNITDQNPFCNVAVLTEEQRMNGTQYPKVRTIFFDEFISRDYYLADEFTKFQRMVSNVVRKEAKTRVFMAGNTISPYCPYFEDMGLFRIKKQQKGTIDVYQYDREDEHGKKLEPLLVSVEYCDSPSKKEDSSIYFAFNNPKLKMITEGDWEVNLYPHLPHDYIKANVIYQYFIEYMGEKMHCEVIYVNQKGSKPMMFTYVHRKTTEIKDLDNYTMIYTQEHSPLHNHSRRLNHPSTELESKLWRFFQTEKVFYQDNTIGETMRSYLNWCNTCEY